MFPAASPAILKPDTNGPIFLAEGESYNLECTAKGYPLPKVRWLDIAKTAEASRNIPFKANATYNDLPAVTSVMRLESVVTEFTRNYSCYAFSSNTASDTALAQAKSSVQVVVLGKALEIHPQTYRNSSKGQELKGQKVLFLLGKQVYI